MTDNDDQWCCYIVSGWSGTSPPCWANQRGGSTGTSRLTRSCPRSSSYILYFIELSIIDIVKHQNMSDLKYIHLCREVLITPANPSSGWSWSPSTTSTTRRPWRPSHPRYTSSCSQSCSLKRWVICHHTLYPSLTLFIDIKYSSFSAGLDYSDLSQVGGDPRGQQGQDLGRGINH